MSNKYFCTCGYEAAFERNAFRHVAIYHATCEQQRDEELFKDRIRVMISSPFCPFSFDGKLYSLLYAAKG
jgi:hypothetical protein